MCPGIEVVEVRDDEAGGLHETGIAATIEHTGEHEGWKCGFEVLHGFLGLGHGAGCLKDRVVGVANRRDRRAELVAPDQFKRIVERAALRIFIEDIIHARKLNS